MPIVNINGVNISYEVPLHAGTVDCAVAWRTPRNGEMCGRWPKDWRQRAIVLFIHDRRNCGVSDVSFDGNQSEYEVWVDDLYAIACEV